MNSGWWKSRWTFDSCLFLIAPLQLCHHLLLRTLCPLAFHPSDTLYHNEIFTLLLLQSDEIRFIFSLQDKTNPDSINTFSDLFLHSCSVCFFAYGELRELWDILPQGQRISYKKITPALGNCSKVKSELGKKCNEGSLPLRGQATCPLLNGKVGSWSLGELCWNGAQGQLCASWRMQRANLKCLPISR